jgi:hypothetical protein
MRTLFCLICSALVFAISARALAACQCPGLSLDQRISDATLVFIGKPVVTAPVPGGGSPFHSEMTMQSPHGAIPSDWVTLFRVDTIWKGEGRKTVRVRHEQGECAVSFKEDVPAIVFAQADPSGVFWTRTCSGDLLEGEAGYDELKQVLTSRLKFD